MRLYLLRHARAEIVGDAARDDSRGLTEEGLREAAGVGSWLSTRSEPPTHVLCSPARRAVETMERVIAALSEKPATSISEDLYLGSAWKLFEKVRGTEPGVSSLMLVGHNPGIAELAAKLSGPGDPGRDGALGNELGCPRARRRQVGLALRRLVRPTLQLLAGNLQPAPRRLETVYG
jgi:phosphohistidine phosphatase